MVIFVGRKHLMKQAYLVAQSDPHPTGDQEVVGSIPARSGNILLWRLIDLGIISTVILSLLLIQEGHWSVFGERMYKSTS